MNDRVGPRIKQYLESKGITQAFVAEKSGIAANILNPALKAKRRLTAEEYFIICEVLEVPLDTFKDNKAS